MKSRFFIFLIALITLLTFLLTGCNSSSVKTSDDADKGSETGNSDNNTDTVKAGTIVFNGDSVDVGNTGTKWGDGKLTISAGGSYELKGTLNNGQIYICVDKAEQVELVLNGASITCSDSAAIYAVSSDKLIINLAEGTTNTLSDGKSYKFAEGTDEPNACVYSDDDISINGTGTLVINANYDNGISSKNDVKIKEATLSVTAINTAIRGKDSVKISSGSLSITAGKDGIKASNSTEKGQGIILVEGGTITIVAEDDALQAVSDITATGGSITVTAGGKATNCDGTTNITEGILTKK